ncbi:Alpha-(1,3)-fucosyltransferase 11 [Mortierella sp. AD031]|nr:Alpha-(1,3)-fucosyltransferase 11 [Mortierella sp. AD031]KAG0209932.1 Alpha-(1,3)-fucosyltransferase 11 [Mortierella sp. NVP41]
MSVAKKEYPILWWTPWFDTDRYEGEGLMDNCGLPYNCRHTLDRSKYDESKVVVFHEPDWDSNDLPPLQDVHDGKKAWVLNTAETPNSGVTSHISYFTYRSTYHFGSDFVMSYFRAGRSHPEAFINIVTRPPLHTLEEKNRFRKHGFSEDDSRPLAPVAWIVSNCKAPNGRHFMVNQLRKYIDVDVYGKCMPNREWPKGKDGREQMPEEELVSHYKFYLALENGNCEDYVTEKLERTFASGAVPVVDGPQDYSRYTPAENSIIRYDDYGSPKLLAKFLKALDSDDKAYQQHLAYKANRTAENTDEDGRVITGAPAAFNQNYKERLLPWFVDNWDIDESGFANKTTDWLSKDGPQGTIRAKYNMQWGADTIGSRCALCRVQRDLVEGDTVIDVSKRIGIDTTCTFRKFYYPSWAIAFYPYLTMLTVVLVSVLLFLLLTRRGRDCVKFSMKKVYQVVNTVLRRKRKEYDFFDLKQK